MLKVTSFGVEVVRPRAANLGHNFYVLSLPDYQESKMDHRMVPHPVSHLGDLALQSLLKKNDLEIRNI